MNFPMITAACAALAVTALAQAPQDASFSKADESLRAKLEASTKELEALRAELVEKKVELNTELSKATLELSQAREEFQNTERTLATSKLEVTNLRDSIKLGEDRVTWLQNLMAEYAKKLKTRMHPAEKAAMKTALTNADLALENKSLSKAEVFEAQLALVDASLDRIENAFGGHRFEGSTVNTATGLIDDGQFLAIGPAVFFTDVTGKVTGTSEFGLGDFPSSRAFSMPEDATAAADVIKSRVGELPLDPTLGDAHRVEAMQETFVEHVQKGGTMMWPIFGLAGIALLIALYKWISLSMIGKPTRREVKALLEDVAEGNFDAATGKARKMKGPAGKMLAIGVDHHDQPRELVEEAMYEQVLTTRLKVNNMLPFIGICAASAPLLGLLGTVIGIIATFRLITEFGSGDVQMLSSGISVALITTKFGLIVAIPSLILHAYLARKARGVIGTMETLAVAFANHLAKRAPKLVRTSSSEGTGGGTIDQGHLRDQVGDIIRDMLGPISGNGNGTTSTQVS